LGGSFVIEQVEQQSMLIQCNGISGFIIRQNTESTGISNMITWSRQSKNMAV